MLIEIVDVITVLVERVGSAAASARDVASTCFVFLASFFSLQPQKSYDPTSSLLFKVSHKRYLHKVDL